MKNANSPSPFFAIFRHFSPLVVFEIKHFRHQGNYRISFDACSDPTKFKDDWPPGSG